MSFGGKVTELNSLNPNSFRQFIHANLLLLSAFFDIGGGFFGAEGP